MPSVRVTGMMDVSPLSLLLLQFPHAPKQKLAESSVSALGTLSNPEEPNWVGLANNGDFVVRRKIMMNSKRTIIEQKLGLFSGDPFLQLLADFEKRKFFRFNVD